jgi:hypothetical protein
MPFLLKVPVSGTSSGSAGSWLQITFSLSARPWRTHDIKPEARSAVDS